MKLLTKSNMQFLLDIIVLVIVLYLVFYTPEKLGIGAIENATKLCCHECTSIDFAVRNLTNFSFPFP